MEQFVPTIPLRVNKVRTGNQLDYLLFNNTADKTCIFNTYRMDIQFYTEATANISFANIGVQST